MINRSIHSSSSYAFNRSRDFAATKVKQVNIVPLPGFGESNAGTSKGGLFSGISPQVAAKKICRKTMSAVCLKGMCGPVVVPYLIVLSRSLAKTRRAPLKECYLAGSS